MTQPALRDQPYQATTAPAAKIAQKLFIVGCPRSGTTWLQIMLSEHPSIASRPETHLFQWYVHPLMNTWERDKKGISDVGLHRSLSEQEFLQSIRAFTDITFEKLGENQPDAEYLLEKTPDHIKDFEIILKLFPDARFLHIIRDPRAVAASFKAAHAHKWGRHWAPKRPEFAANKWLETMRLRPAISAATPNYMEIKYEDLLSDTFSRIKDVFEWLGLTVSDGFCAQVAENCSLNRLKENRVDGVAKQIGGHRRATYYRTGTTDGWREELSADEIATIEHMTKDTMAELGYKPLYDPNRLPLSTRLALAKRQIRHALAPYARAIADRLS